MSVWVGAVPISFGHLLISLSFRVGTIPISIGHSSCQFQFEFSSWDRTYIDRSFVVSVWVGAAPISISHLPISLSFRVGTVPVSIGHSSRQFQFEFSSRDRTYIDRSFVMSVWVWVFESRPHLYRSVIFHVSLRFGAAPISIGHVPITFRVQFESGLHLYRSVIFHVSLRFGVAPTLIGHVPIAFRVQYESGLHLYRSVIYHVSFSLFWVGVAPISIDHVPIAFHVSLSENHIYIDLSFFMSVCVSGPHLYWSLIHHVSF